MHSLGLVKPTEPSLNFAETKSSALPEPSKPTKPVVAIKRTDISYESDVLDLGCNVSTRAEHGSTAFTKAEATGKIAMAEFAVEDSANSDTTQSSSEKENQPQKKSSIGLVRAF